MQDFGEKGEERREIFSQSNFSKFFYITVFENKFLGPAISRKLNFSEEGTLGGDKFSDSSFL